MRAGAGEEGSGGKFILHCVPPQVLPIADCMTQTDIIARNPTMCLSLVKPMPLICYKSARRLYNRYTVTTAILLHVMLTEQEQSELSVQLTTSNNKRHPKRARARDLTLYTP